MIRIQKMSESDAEKVATIHVRSWQVAYDGIMEQSFLDAINISNRALEWKNGMIHHPEIIRLVAEENGEIIGFASGGENRKLNLLPGADCELWAIYVHPDQFRNGAGSALFLEFKNQMIESGKHTLAVWVLRDNIQGRKFYERHGGVYQGVSEDVAVGARRLAHLAYEFNLVG
jgi:ribosomal protein S18 acetylase RimI-like enzyme